MRYINPTSPTDAKTRCLTFVLALSIVSASVTPATQTVAAVSGSVVRKVQKVQQESREIIRFSVRLYRFYKLSSEQPVIQSRSCE